MHVDIGGVEFPIDEYLSYQKTSELRSAIGNMRFHALNFTSLNIKEAIIYEKDNATELEAVAVKEDGKYYITYKKTHKKNIYSLKTHMSVV